MSVLVQYATMVVRICRIEGSYPDGFLAFRKEHIDGLTSWHDKDLAVITNMDGAFLMAEAKSLARKCGFRIIEDDQSPDDDIVIITGADPPRFSCAWLEFRRHPAGFSYCWLKGQQPGYLAGPKWPEPKGLRNRKILETFEEAVYLLPEAALEEAIECASTEPIHDPIHGAPAPSRAIVDAIVECLSDDPSDPHQGSKKA